MSDDTLAWDWRGQPDLDRLAAILARHGVRLEQVDTGTDQYEVRISSEGPTLVYPLRGREWSAAWRWVADMWSGPPARTERSLLAELREDADLIDSGTLTPWAEQPEVQQEAREVQATGPERQATPSRGDEGGTRVCDALCRDVEEDRDRWQERAEAAEARLAVVVRQAGEHWRTGTSLGTDGLTLYRHTADGPERGRLVGMMRHPADAALVAEAVNAELQLREYESGMPRSHDPGGAPYPELLAIYRDAEALLAGRNAGHPELLAAELRRMRGELDDALRAAEAMAGGQTGG